LLVRCVVNIWLSGHGESARHCLLIGEFSVLLHAIYHRHLHKHPQPRSQLPD
jgi:hypothetical protein